MNIKAFIKKYTMTIALVVVFVMFSFLTQGRLLKDQNISNLLLQNSYVLIMACGMLLCILTGGNVDLSVGSTLCLIAAIASQLMSKFHLPALAVIVIGLGISAAIGIYQGFMIGYVHIPPFICTLGGMFLFRGLARAILASKTVAIQNETYFNIFASYITVPGIDKDGNHVSALIVGLIIVVIMFLMMFRRRKSNIRKGYKNASLVNELIKTLIIAAIIILYTNKLRRYKGIPVMLIWLFAVIAIFTFVTSNTAFGRYFYAVGGNEKATKLSGIDPRRVYFFAYMLMSILAGLAGLIHAARIGAVDGNMGNAFEMDAIGSCFIGGASAYGGSGTVPGIMVGAIFLGVINMGMSILGMSDQWQYVVKGIVLLIAVTFDVISNHKTGKS